MNQSTKEAQRYCQRQAVFKNGSLMLVIILLNWISCHKSLQGYFLADDFVHIDYLFHVFQGNWQSLLTNFWGNWMQAEGTTFYRPLISITLALDYLFQGPNAFIFHLSNCLYQTLASLLVFLCGKQIVRALAAESHPHIQFLPLAAAMLFSVHPLHCEVVNWVIARVDSVALTFSLAAFWFWCRELNNNHSTVGKISLKSWGARLSLLFLTLALMSKEMAITVPPALTWLALWQSPGNLKEKLAYACKQTAPLWCLLVLYLVWRTLVLGTVAGGYQGSVGAGLTGSLIKRWLLDGSQMRVLFPFNVDIFGAYHSLSGQLKYCYALILFNFFATFALSKSRLSLLKGPLFCLGWYVICLAPTYQVWNLTPNLQGSRFVYFATAPLTMGLAWLLFPSMSKRYLTVLRTLILVWLTSLYVGITYGDNRAWSHAMEEVRAFKDTIAALSSRLAPAQKFSLLNIPHTYRGAHMLYNAATMSVLLNKPLCTFKNEPPADHIITFEPATFGDGDLIAVSRLKRLLQICTPLYLWDRESFSLVPLTLQDKAESGESAECGGQIIATKLSLEDGKEMASGPLDLNPLAIDYIDVALPADDKAVLILKAAGNQGRKFEMSMPLKVIGGAARFQVSEHKQWLALEKVSQITLTLKGKSTAEADRIATGSLADKQPTVTPDLVNLIEDNDGICRVRGARPTFSYDATNVPGAKKVLVEFSKPNSWFEHYSGSLRNSRPSSEAAISNTLNKPRGVNLPLNFAGLKGHGYFQIRLIAIDENDKPIGYFSDPLNFQM